MANSYSPSPISITAAMTSSLRNTTGAIVPGQGPYLLREIYWYQPSASGDTFTITDGNGNTLRQGRCENANQSQIFSYRHEPKGGKEIWDLQVTAISSGTLYIEL